MKTCNGGYAMIDCGGMNLLAQSAQTIAGIYAKVSAAFDSKKPVIACNMIYGVDAISCVPVFLVKELSGTIIATASVVQIIITAADEVTIVNLAPANRSKKIREG